jgi:trehalose-6-phosphate synthase
MPPEERASRAAMLRRVVEENSVEKWVQAQFADIAAKLAGGA